MTQISHSKLSRGAPVSGKAKFGRLLRPCGTWLLLGSAVLSASAVLSGCAGAPGGTGAQSAEPLTQFDEPETRKRARIRTTLASSYFEQGQDTVALDEVKQALAADANYGPALVLRGLVYMRLNDDQRAEESFVRALQINPKDSDALHNYGWFACGHKREKESLSLFERAIANPT